MTRPGARQKIVPYLWFDDQAEEATAFYASLFAGSSIRDVTRYVDAGQEIHQRPAGSVMAVDFDLAGYRMVALNGGPMFRFTPAISFYVTVEEKDEVDRLYHALVDGGMAMMPLDTYDWSPRYSWVQDRYGLTWQLTQGRVEEIGSAIVPSLMYVTERPVAEAAMQRYTSVFEDARVIAAHHYPPGSPGPEGGVMHARFHLAGQPFTAMDASAGMHAFGFTEAISLMIQCDSQQEIDHYWDALTEGGDPAAQQCGWLKDAYGVSWQVAPRELSEMLSGADPETANRVTNAFLQMKKFDLEALREAYRG